jgi:hypothetical protein
MKKLIYSALITTLSLGLFSCSDDNDNKEEESTVPSTTGYYILNRGNWGKNDANVAYYNNETNSLTKDYYNSINNEKLGSDAEQIFRYGNKLYISVTTSNRIVITDLELNKLGEIKPTNASGEDMAPRCFTAQNGKVYVSYYYGSAIGVVDTTSLTVTNTIDLGKTDSGMSKYPEQLCSANGNIYVALSEYGAGKTVGVINTTTNKLEKEIEVVLNPTCLEAGSNGDVYVISLGNYYDILNTLQVIHSNGTVETLGNATKMTAVGDYLYTIYAQYGGPTPAVNKYSLATNKLVAENLVTIADANSLDVDPISENIYICTSVYGNTCDLYVYGQDGKQIGNAVSTGGYDAQKVLFIVENK